MACGDAGVVHGQTVSMLAWMPVLKLAAVQGRPVLGLFGTNCVA